MKKRILSAAALCLSMAPGAYSQDGHPETRHERRASISDMLHRQSAEIDLDVMFLDRSSPEGMFASELDPDSTTGIRLGYALGNWEFAYMGTDKWRGSADILGERVHHDTMLHSVEATRSLFAAPISGGCLNVGAGFRYIGLYEDVEVDNVQLGRDTNNSLVGAQYVLDYEKQLARNVAFVARNTGGLYSNFASINTDVFGDVEKDRASLAAVSSEFRVGLETHLARGWIAETSYQMTYLGNTVNATDQPLLGGPTNKDDFYAQGLVLGLSKSW